MVHHAGERRAGDCRKKAKATKHGEPLPNASEAPLESRRDSESAEQPNAADREPASERAEQLEKEELDSKILNGGKDFVIKQLREERDGFVQQLVEGSRHMGQLQSELRQLSAPRKETENGASSGA